MGNSLKQLYEKHTGKVTDKWSSYLDEWDRIFEQYQNDAISLLEIGVQNGGSLEIWSKYFVNAKKIVGCDIDENCRCLQYDDNRVNVIIGDANAEPVQEMIAQQSSDYDIIIDDGSHKSSDIIHSFMRYFKLLNDDGVYIVEDLHASYWAEYEGGLHNPYTAMAFFKRIADVVNFEHWRNGQSRESIFEAFDKHYQFGVNTFDLEKIHSIEFINSLCIIKKAPASQNELGGRIIAGNKACV